MSKGFSLDMCPWAYRTQYQGDGRWKEEYIEQPHLGPKEEAKLDAEAKAELLRKRNAFPDMPLVNYTTQYGMGCFEGLKAFPQPDGSLKLFRPDENAKRMESSMKGLYMPALPWKELLEAVRGVAGKNKALGFAPVYDPAWKKGDFVSGTAMYIRPFSYAEPGIGVGISQFPWVVVIATPVGSYFMEGSAKAVTTHRVRAYPGGTGWIKCDANYVASALAKKDAENAGFMETIFLDAREHRFFEEGSSCNIFFVMKDGSVVTPDLGDTILPGITRKSILVLAKDLGLKTAERRISVEEVFSDAKECFLSGTAAGVSYIESITHDGKEAVFGNRKTGDVTRSLLKALKGIQYGAVPDAHGWMVPALD